MFFAYSFNLQFSAYVGVSLKQESQKAGANFNKDSGENGHFSSNPVSIGYRFIIAYTISFITKSSCQTCY